MIIKELKVGDESVWDVELTFTTDGNFEYRVPDVIGIDQPNNPIIQQVSIEHGVGPGIKKVDLIAALQDLSYTLDSEEAGP